MSWLPSQRVDWEQRQRQRQQQSEAEAVQKQTWRAADVEVEARLQVEEGKGSVVSSYLLCTRYGVGRALGWWAVGGGC